MGSSSTKFRKHLQNGDEYAALQLWYSSADLRKGLDPNCSYGDAHNHDSPLHYAARHAMKSLLRIFLYELGGNPNKRNGQDETLLHSVCLTTIEQTYPQSQRRAECLAVLLQWKGAPLKDGQVEKVDLAAQDKDLNTSLHYAAAGGLRRCVEVLVTQNAPLFVENKDKLTPCDCAEKNGHRDIAMYLESKMVFSNEEENEDEMDLMLDEMECEEGYSGLRAQDLQEAKDQLLVATSDMLRVPLFTAEALLRNHEWSREMLLEAWMDDPVACCEKCGVTPPSALFLDRASTSADTTHTLNHDLNTPTQTVPPRDQIECDICTCLIPAGEEPVPSSCDHQFCRSCWDRYLTVKIQEGDAHNITCPGYQCTRLVPVEILETLVSRDMARRYLQFDIKAFVESNPNIKWCPYPACGRAVKLPDSDNPLSPTCRGLNDMSSTTDYSHAVDCGNGHVFCWECLGEAHEPASCENWKKWHQKIIEIKPEECNTDDDTEVSANCLWLVTNSKPCPNCKSPIQKNEGCNHMKCSKCKHDFCWVCLEPWKRHSSSTGGYFRCNRYEVVKKVEENHDMLKAEAEEHNKQLQELNRLMHYYTRFKNHEHSFQLEEPLLSTAKEKMMILARAVSDPDTANLETKFVEDAVCQLLKARRVLKCSYVYGYYLEETGYKKPIFEFMQTELEECTETLSEMIARPYLRTPRSRIIQTAHLVQRKRHELVAAIAKGLVPADSSPNSRRKRHKFSAELDDDLKKALLASLQDLDPNNPWVKDPSGKHTNVSALLDWPDDSDDSDTENAAAKNIENEDSEEASGNYLHHVTSEGWLSIEQGLAVCLRPGCGKVRAQNPRTGEIHDHCSMKCMRLDKMERSRQEEQEELKTAEHFVDYQLDLLRALEMSRLQFLREMGQLRPGSGERTPRSPNPSSSAPVESGASPGEPQPVIPGFVLTEPPRGRNWKPLCNPASEETGKNVANGSEQESVEDEGLETVLEISRISLRDEENDLRLAIQLSLQDSETPRAECSPVADDIPMNGHVTRERQQDVYSTINLPRLPADNPDTADNEQGAASISNEKDSACSNGRTGDFRHVIGPARSHKLPCSSNPFGLMKDISVSNIIPTEIDKTKDFEDKNFSQAFAKYATTLPEGTDNSYHVVTSDHAHGEGDMNRLADDCTNGNLEEGLETALRNLSDMSTSLPGCIDHPEDELIINSDVLEQLLQGAEKYGGEATELGDDDADIEQVVILEQSALLDDDVEGGEGDNEGVYV